MIAILDYGVGNLFSVEKAFAVLGVDARITKRASDIRAAEKIVLPGVGAFGDCMKNLEESGLLPALLASVKSGTPLLGICVGLQILFESSEESPGVKGLGLLKGKVRKIKAPGLKIPHMGWNSIEITAKTRENLFRGLGETPYVYFVHSYHAKPTSASVLTSTALYGKRITASVAKDNIMAVQFHPEKSGDVGLAILKNFVEE